jgi:hypothetical protein
VEVKTGPNAELRVNQDENLAEIQATGGAPVGKRARDARYEPGDTIGPTQVMLVQVLSSTLSISGTLAQIQIRPLDQ